MGSSSVRLVVALLAVLAAWSGPGDAGFTSIGPLLAISATNGDTPFAGDRRLLTTISPNGDGFRDRALIHLRLSRTAVVRMEVTKTALVPRTVFVRAARLGPGLHTFAWAPHRSIEPRTYLVLLRVESGGRTYLYGARTAEGQWHGDTPVVRVQGLDVAAGRPSYRAGDLVRLRVAADAERLTLQVFGLGSRLVRTLHDGEMHGEPVTPPMTISWTAHRTTPGSIRVRLGAWPSGLYFVEARDESGRAGYAPLVVRPNGIGEHRVAIVLPTNTWQAYNREDLDGNGWGDTWYAGWVLESALLGRHYEGWGMPPNFRRYDLPFLRWSLNRGRGVDYLSDADLARIGDARTLRRAYALIVFEGHTEYVTAHEYDLIEGYRDRGGNLAYLTANDFFRHVAIHGRRMHVSSAGATRVAASQGSSASSTRTTVAVPRPTSPATSRRRRGSSATPGSATARVSCAAGSRSTR